MTVYDAKDSCIVTHTIMQCVENPASNFLHRCHVIVLREGSLQLLRWLHEVICKAHVCVNVNTLSTCTHTYFYYGE